MKNLIPEPRLFCLLTKSTFLLLLLLNGFTAFAQDPDVKGPVNSMFGNVALLGNQWQVTECCGWSGTWTRRPNTNTFDAVWRHTNGTSASDVIELMSWNKTTNIVILYRKSMNGSYTAHYNPNSKTLTNGTTTWYPAGQLWSAIIR